MLYCNNCKKTYPDGRNFCPMCGTRLEDELNIYGETFYAGDAAAFERIYKSSCKWVRKYVYDRISSAEVEDCIQNIYIKLYENIGKFNPGTGKFRPWFNTLMRNETIDFIRKANSRQGKDVPMYAGEDEEEMDFEDTSAIPEDIIDQKETGRLVREILSALTEEQRICIVLYYMENMKQDEIARELEISAGTVKSRLHYGKEKIREKVLLLEKQGTKLYGLAPVPFFILLLRMCRSDELVAGTSADAMWKSISAKTFAAKAQGAAQAKAGLSAGAKKAAVQSTVRAAAGASGKAVTTKIIIGVVVAALAVGGGITGYRLHNKLKSAEQAVAETETETPEQKEDNPADTGDAQAETGASAPGDNPAAVTDTNAAASTGYDGILQAYTEMFNMENLSETNLPALIPVDLYYSMLNADLFSYLEAQYYALYDINGDGVEECLVSSSSENKLDSIFGSDVDIWTMVGDQPKLIHSREYRSGLSIREQGIICSAASGGADYWGLYFYKMGTDLQLLESYTTEDGGETYVNDGTQAVCTEQDLLNKYPLYKGTLEWKEFYRK